VFVVRIAAEELLVSLVVELTARGEDPSVRYAPTAATRTTTTIPARTVVLAALRRLEDLG
jgi:hypothetical protein